MWSAFIPNPNVQRVTALFDRLINPVGMTFGYFSDDSCASFRCADGVLMVNLDISGCDGSHTRRIFELLEWLTEGTNHAATAVALVNQCKLPLEYRQDKVFMSFTPVDPVLYSGTVITTFTNNIGVSGIGAALESSYSPTLTMDEMYALIPIACASVGYLMTCQRCVNPEDLQFLKMSPCFLESGELSCCLNLGVILRTIGQCAGPLPGKKKIPESERILNFNSGVVAGFVHAGDHGLLRVLREKYPSRGSVIKSSYLLQNLSGRCDRASDLSVCKRYGITPSEWNELLDLLDSSSPGDILWCPAGEKILNLDYGLSNCV
jgi:hypothetical protein